MKENLIEKSRLFFAYAKNEPEKTGFFTKFLFGDGLTGEECEILF